VLSNIGHLTYVSISSVSDTAVTGNLLPSFVILAQFLHAFKRKLYERFKYYCCYVFFCFFLFSFVVCQYRE